jgi:predicted dehydrogenase
MREIGIGLIGVGWMGRLHTTAYRRVPAHFPECEGVARLIVAADEVPENARAAVEQLGFARATTDADEVIDDPDVDAISITTPNHLHLPLCLRAAAAGQAFWGEKPLGRDPGETARIAAAALEAGATTMVGFNYRNVPVLVRARELIDSGALGDVRTFHGRFLVDYAGDENRGLSWRFLRDAAGLGVLGDLMSHVVDLAHHLVGRLDAVTAFKRTDVAMRPMPPEGRATQFDVIRGGRMGAVENEDYVAALATFRDAGRAVLEVSRTAVGRPCDLGVEVIGTRGALAWDFQRMNELRVHRGETGPDGGYVTVPAGPGHGEYARFQPDAGISMSYDDLKVIEAYRFLQSIADGRDRSPNVLDALAVAEVLDAMDRSCATGRWERVRELAEA